MSLVRRKIDVTIILGTGAFGEDPAGKANTVTISGSRVSASVIKAGSPSLDQATIQIFGLTKSKLNQLTRMGRGLAYVRNNTIVISAGDDVAGMSQVFSGTIINAYGDFTGAPESVLNVTATGAALGLAKPVAALSYPGGTDVAVIANQIAASMGRSFINYGVTAQLYSPYFCGTAVDQMRSLAVAGDFYWAQDGGQNQDSIVIWPKGKARGSLGPLISPATGLVGYPTYSDFGIGVRTLFMPGLLFGINFTLDTEIEPAKGVWNIISMVYDLESETPGGAWFIDIAASRLIDVQ